MVSTRDLAWAAGFLEGEGTFTLCGGKVSKYPRVQATQVQLWPLEKLQSLFGGGISAKKANGVGKQPCHSWSLTQVSQAVGVMMTVYPMMTPRRQEQIRTCLSVWKMTPLNHGEKHSGVTVSDTIAKQAIQRVLDGESMNNVARSYGVSHVTVRNWVRGVSRPYLRQEVPGDRAPWIKIYHTDMVSDAVALESIQRVKRGASIKDVSKEVGVTQAALKTWMAGKARPYLLAALMRGEA